MKILAIGDFHGKFPVKLKKKIEARKSEIDLIVGLGDYADADLIRKIIFKNWSGKKWYEVVGMKKAKELEKQGFNSGIKILKELNKLRKPSYILWGNTDFYKEYTTNEPPIIMPGFFEDKIKNLKNLAILDKHKKKFKNIEFLGHGGYVDVTEFIKNPVDNDKKRIEKRLKRYQRDERRLTKLFLNKKPKKDFILAIHYAPLNVLDKVDYKGSPMHGKNVGWEPYNKVIKKYKPKLVLCGHMHEYQAKKKLGTSLVVNPGAAQDGKAAIIDTETLKVEFLK